MAAVTHARAAVAEPIPRPRRSGAHTHRRVRSRVRARGGIAWIAIMGVLLAGIVFVNVAVLRLNLALNSTHRQQADLQAQIATDQSTLSRELASPRIQARAQAQGLVQADPSQIGYINLGGR